MVMFAVPATVLQVGSGTVQGAVTNTVGGGALAGGMVRILDSSRLVELGRGAVDGAGNYSIANVPAGNQIAQYNAPEGYGVGNGDPDDKPAAVPVNGVVVVNFTGTSSYFYEDFQRFANDAALFDATTGLGAIAPFTNATSFGIDAGGAIHLDLTGGPAGDKAMRYDWPNRAGLNSNFRVGFNLQVRNGSRVASPTDQLWIRCLDKFTLGFHEGDAGLATSMAYKQLRAFFINPGFSDADFGVNASGNGQTTGYTSVPYITFAEDAFAPPTHTINPAFNFGDNLATFDGQYHAWVMGVIGVNSGSATIYYYRDGVLLYKFGPGLAFGGNPAGDLFWSCAFGDVMNNGPDQAQSRWIRQMGVYYGRPNLFV